MVYKFSWIKGYHEIHKNLYTTKFNTRTVYDASIISGKLLLISLYGVDNRCKVLIKRRVTGTSVETGLMLLRGPQPTKITYKISKIFKRFQDFI